MTTEVYKAIEICETLEEYPIWYVHWDYITLGAYKYIIKPWCEANLEYPTKYHPHGMVDCVTREDAMLLFLRFR